MESWLPGTTRMLSPASNSGSRWRCASRNSCAYPSAVRSPPTTTRSGSSAVTSFTPADNSSPSKAGEPQCRSESWAMTNASRATDQAVYGRLPPLGSPRGLARLGAAAGHGPVAHHRRHRQLPVHLSTPGGELRGPAPGRAVAGRRAHVAAGTADAVGRAGRRRLGLAVLAAPTARPGRACVRATRSPAVPREPDPAQLDDGR